MGDAVASTAEVSEVVTAEVSEVVTAEDSAGETAEDSAENTCLEAAEIEVVSEMEEAASEADKITIEEDLDKIIDSLHKLNLKKIKIKSTKLKKNFKIKRY